MCAMVCHPHQQRAIAAPKRKTCRSSPQGDIELMTEKEDLALKPAPRLEQDWRPTLQASGGSQASKAMILPFASPRQSGRIEFSAITPSRPISTPQRRSAPRVWPCLNPVLDPHLDPDPARYDRNMSFVQAYSLAFGDRMVTNPDTMWRELPERFQMLKPQLLTNRQHVPVVAVRGARCRK